MMICACAGVRSETGRRVFVCMAVGGSQWGEADQGEGVTVAWWTIAREQYVGQGLALANLSWLEPWLGVLNFCMHDQWHWIKKSEKDSGVGEGKEQVRAMLKDIIKQEHSALLLFVILKWVTFCKWLLIQTPTNRRG